MKINSAKFVNNVIVIDPDNGNEVQLDVYKHQSGGMLAVDTSFIVDNYDDDEPVMIADPFNNNALVELTD